METLRKGSSGPSVVLLQKCLSQLGYDIGRSGIDGKFGPATKAAVMQFQSDQGLERDGIVGRQTWNALSAKFPGIITSGGSSTTTPAATLPRNCDEYRGATFEPSAWNDGGQIQQNNNCYNYACNTRTDTFAQPGRASSVIPTDTDCVSYERGAQGDGLSPIDCDSDCPRSLQSPQECHKAALVIWPGVDFHWFRLDDNGKWSHKPGSTEAKNIDNSGNLIDDPRTADRGPYKLFCGCFCVCKCSFNIR